MRAKTWAAAALMLAAVMPGAIAAQDSDPVAFRTVSDQDVVVLDPAKTYLLVESPMWAMPSFIVMPSDEQRADWARQRAAALAEAIERFPRVIARYEEDIAVFNRVRRRGETAPLRPEFPTEANFGWPDLESRRIASTGPLNRFFKSDDVSLWLSEVPPGEYVFYGFGFGPTAIAAGTCMCMGSVGFTVEPGQITAVRVGSQFTTPGGGRSSRPPDDSNTTDIMTRQVMIIEPTTNAIYDPRLPRDRMVQASFQPIETLPNWFGGTIGRVEPIAGVLAYERDKLIDLRPSALPLPTAAPEVAAEAGVEAEVQPAAVN